MKYPRQAEKLSKELFSKQQSFWVPLYMAAELRFAVL
jgi:hypothetical protein